MITTTHNLTAEEIFAEWRRRRIEYSKYSTAERDQILIDRVLEMRADGLMTFSSFDVAWAEQDWKVTPMPQNQATAEEMRFFGSMNRDELVLVLMDAGPRSSLYAKYRWACRRWGFEMIYIAPPIGFTNQELDEFERFRAGLSGTECRRLYSDPKDQFKVYSDACDERASYLRDKPIQLSIQQYRSMTPHAIAARWNEPKFRAAVEHLRRKGLL